MWKYQHGIQRRNRAHMDREILCISQQNVFTLWEVWILLLLLPITFYLNFEQTCHFAVLLDIIKLCTIRNISTSLWKLTIWHWPVSLGKYASILTPFLGIFSYIASLVVEKVFRLNNPILDWRK